MHWHMVLVVLLAAAGLLPAAPVTAQTDQRCFPETGQCISGRFREYWEQNGGVAVFGFPLTSVRNERSHDGGQLYRMQWFERNRFEWHPENRPPYDMLLGRLGEARLQQQGVDWRSTPRDTGAMAGCLWFEQTRLNVCDEAPGRGFMTFWQTHSLADPALDAYGQSLALLGLPVTAPRLETNAAGDRVLTQWFERARLEWHPDKPAEHSVLLGLLSAEVGPPATAPAIDAPPVLPPPGPAPGNACN